MDVLKQHPSAGAVRKQHGFTEDFGWYISPHLWTTTATDSGTAAITAGGVGGILNLAPSDGTVADNDEIYVFNTNSVFKPASGQPLVFDAFIQFTEANTDDANVAVGLASSVAANLIVDDGAGLRASGAVIAIYKVDGETVWRFVTRNGTAVTTSVSDKTAGGSAYQHLQIEVSDSNLTYATVAPIVDGQYLRDSTTGQVIRHQLLLTGIAAMSAFVGAKNGGSNNESVNVDFVNCYQQRA